MLNSCCAPSPRGKEHGAGLVQTLLVLVVLGAMVMLALKLMQRSGIEQLSPTGGHPARAVLDTDRKSVV